MKKFVRLFVFIMLGCALSLLVTRSSAVIGQPTLMHLPDLFVDETIVSGLKLPTSFAIAPDGRIFITQKSGEVRVFANGQLQPGNFIDLSAETNTASDRGLMAVAVHPNFPATPYVYLAYVYEPPEVHGYDQNGARVSRLLRVQADPNNLNAALPGSAVVLLGANSTFANIGNPAQGDKAPYSCHDADGGFIRDCLPVEGTSHVLDFMLFGKDGALYLSSGDGINFVVENVRAQKIDSLSGKILRINPITGNGYPTNPYYDGDPGSNRSKVYALGLRNPYRFALHPTTGELYVGEVGNNKWEEISRGRAGTNFGWPCYEGPVVTTTSNATCDEVFNGTRPATPAIYQYPHEKGWGAAIAGDFYTGSSYPAIYRNKFFFADFNVGQIDYLTTGSDGAAQLNRFATNVLGPVQITAGPNGDLYVLKIQAGMLARIRYTGPADNGSTAQAAKQSAATGNKPVNNSAAPSTDASTPTGAGAGKILREWWSGVSGKTIADLTESPQFAKRPTGSELLPNFEAPANVGDDYGTRIRGYLYPPVTGQYRFWIAGDDSAQLWLSTNDNPANRQLIASASQWTRSRQWDKYTEQQSVLITLQAGKRYYIEALHKEADQKDNLAVAWQIPGGSPTVIDGAYLTPVSQ
ncbi:MAG: PQQ-dependent sugar dehydrogenase [Caldilineaceae bacterium]